MGVKIKKRGTKWYVYVDYHGKRKNRSVGTREAAERVRREIEARLALGDVSFLTQHDSGVPVFGAFADRWLAGYARVECKTSTADGYEGVLRQYLRPRFATKPLNEIRRDDVSHGCETDTDFMCIGADETRRILEFTNTPIVGPVRLVRRSWT